LRDAELAAAGVATPQLSARVCAGLPLILGGEVIGTIAVLHVEAGCYRDDHRRVLEEICQQASAVVHNALVFERTQDKPSKTDSPGSPSARGLRLHLAREMDRARRMGDQFSIVLLDFDDFKSINDEPGHHTGDRALRKWHGFSATAPGPTTSASRAAATGSSSCWCRAAGPKPKNGGAHCRTRWRPSRSRLPTAGGCRSA
jgi:hypothetical protein